MAARLRRAGIRSHASAAYCGVMMPPTRWRGGSGLPRLSSSTVGTFVDFASDFAAPCGADDLVTDGFVGFIGVSQ
jgi:hypothetical protein